MHGMDTDEELVYWRERASKAEQELAGAEGELDGLRVSEAFHRDRCDKLEMAAVRKLLPKEQDSFKGCCPLCALREVDYTDEATRLVTADRDYWKQRASGAELSHSTALASLAAVTAERDEARAIGHDAIDKANRYMSEADAARAESERLRGEVERMTIDARRRFAIVVADWIETYDVRRSDFASDVLPRIAQHIRDTGELLALNATTKSTSNE